MAVQHRGSNWTPDEVRRLRDLVEAGKSWVFISANLKRPAKTVRDRIAYLRHQDSKPGTCPQRSRQAIIFCLAALFI
jgi:hypothetical protein